MGQTTAKVSPRDLRGDKLGQQGTAVEPRPHVAVCLPFCSVPAFPSLITAPLLLSPERPSLHYASKITSGAVSTSGSDAVPREWHTGRATPWRGSRLPEAHVQRVVLHMLLIWCILVLFLTTEPYYHCFIWPLFLFHLLWSSFLGSLSFSL